MNNPIIELDLGDLTAERDKRLPLYFVEDIPAFKHSLNLDSRQYILMGRTGSGKSAIISQIIYMCEEEDGYTYSSIDHNKHDLDYIVNEAKKELSSVPDNIEDIIYKLSWHYTIVINMLRNKYKESPLQSFKIYTDVDRMVYDFLKQVDAPSVLSMTIPDLFLSFMRLINLKMTAGFSDVQIEAEISTNQSQTVKTYSNLLRQTEKFVKERLREIIGGDKLYILIDDLDIGWDPNSSTQQKLMSALFSAINLYLNETQIKPVVALRTDIFRGLKVHQREKYQDLILKVEWTQELLRNFLTKRISIVYEIDADKVGSDFFGNKTEHLDLIDYMIQHTLNRPRDLLDLCRIAIKNSASEKASFVTLDHIENALNDYSLNRVIALEDEWKLLYENLENLIKLFPKYSNHDQIVNGYSTHDFHRVLNSIRDYLIERVKAGEDDSEPTWFLDKYGKSDANPLDIVSTLYDLGIIYLINEGKFSTQAYDSTMPKITASTTIKVHPMFSRYMEIMIDESESPWL